MTIPLLLKMKVPVGVNYDAIIAARSVSMHDKFLEFEAKYLLPIFTRR